MMDTVIKSFANILVKPNSMYLSICGCTLYFDEYEPIEGGEIGQKGNVC